MGQIVDDLSASFIIFISTIIIMFFRDFLPEFLFPGFSIAIALVITVLILELIIHREAELSHYLGTVIGVFLAYFLLTLLGLSVQTILEIPNALNMPQVSTLSSILEMPIMSDLYIIEALVIAIVAVKIKVVISWLFSE